MTEVSPSPPKARLQGDTLDPNGDIARAGVLRKEKVSPYFEGGNIIYLYLLFGPDVLFAHKRARS